MLIGPGSRLGPYEVTALIGEGRPTQVDGGAETVGKAVLPHERENTRADRNNSSSDGNAEGNASPSDGDLLTNSERLNLLCDVLE
jgi:hypothetical protein